MDGQLTNAKSRDEQAIEAIGYIEKMNNGRYFVSCGDEKTIDSYWYASADTEKEAIECLLDQDEDQELLETFGKIKVVEIYILQNWMFHDQNLEFQDAIVRVIDVEKDEL